MLGINMNKLDGGVMDFQKEREAFEAWVGSNGRSIERFSDGSYKSMTLDKEWEAWQAAKAQAVPDLGELQERIAGHQYYHDEHGHMIVDMDDVVKEISGFDSWKAQAVPAQLDVNSILHDIDCYFDNGLSNTERTANNLLQSIYEKLSGEVKAQEPAND